MQRVGVNMVLFLHAARGELFATLDRGFHSDRIRRVKGWFRFSPRGANMGHPDCAKRKQVMATRIRVPLPPIRFGLD